MRPYNRIKTDITKKEISLLLNQLDVNVIKIRHVSANNKIQQLIDKANVILADILTQGTNQIFVAYALLECETREDRTDEFLAMAKHNKIKYKKLACDTRDKFMERILELELLY